MKFLLILTLFTLSLNSHGALSGKVFSDGSDANKKYILGDPLELTVQVYPVNEFNEVAFTQSINNKYFLNSFKLIEVLEISHSENNVDVLIYKFQVVYLKPIDTNLIQIHTDNKNYIPF